MQVLKKLSRFLQLIGEDAYYQTDHFKVATYFEQAGARIGNAYVHVVKDEFNYFLIEISRIITYKSETNEYSPFRRNGLRRLCWESKFIHRGVEIEVKSLIRSYWFPLGKGSLYREEVVRYIELKFFIPREPSIQMLLELIYRYL